MLRFSVLAIVLTLGVGPYASNLCRAWCTGDNLPEGCHLQFAQATVVADDCCDGRVMKLSAILSGESRQDRASPTQDAAVAQHPVVVKAASVRLSRRHEPRGSNENWLVTVLRI